MKDQKANLDNLTYQLIHPIPILKHNNPLFINPYEKPFSYTQNSLHP